MARWGFDKTSKLAAKEDRGMMSSKSVPKVSFEKPSDFSHSEKTKLSSEILDWSKTFNKKSPFDPLRLKVLVLPYQDANPVGKNADYFFLKGFKYTTCEEYSNAMSSYLKGLEIKEDHLLCRFNLGVILFKLGLYEEAVAQYETLVKQGYGNRNVVLYNKALSELQSGKYALSIETSQLCINMISTLKKRTSRVDSVSGLASAQL